MPKDDDAVQPEPEPEHKEPENTAHNSFAEGSSNATGAGSNAMGAGSFRIALPIVPVEARAVDDDITTVVNTYGLLDTGSTTSFCTEKLAEMLGARGQKEGVISTLERAHNSMECNVIHLSVNNPSTHHELELPQVYTRKDINLTSAAKTLQRKQMCRAWIIFRIWIFFRALILRMLTF